MSVAEFADAEKDRILYFLRYPNWASLAQSVQLGYPAASQPMFLVFDSFARMRPGARESIRRVLCELEDIETQLGDARSRLKAMSVGTVMMNPRELAMLRQERQQWVRQLADTLGVAENPYSSPGGTPGSVNARVRG